MRFVFRSLIDKKNQLYRQADMRNESLIMSILSEKNISNRYNRSMTPQPFYLEPSGFKSISQKLTPFYSAAFKKNGRFNLTELHKQNHSMLESIKFLHEPFEYNGRIYKIAHRDIKPANFLVQSDVDYRTAATDFDLSAVVSGKDLTELNAKLSDQDFVQVGTPLTIDPNIVDAINNGRKVNFSEVQSSDVWSLGVSQIWNALPANRDFSVSLYPYIMRSRSRAELNTKNKNIPKHLEEYFATKTNSDILDDIRNLNKWKPNDGIPLSEAQLEGVRSFLKSRQYKYIKEKMLVVDPLFRVDLDTAIKDLGGMIQ